MKAKELMLFDLVKRKKDGKVMTVVELRYAETIAAITPDDVYYGDMEDYHESEIDPIPLTPEILEGNANGGWCNYQSEPKGRSIYHIGEVAIYVEWERIVPSPYIEIHGLGDTFFKGYVDYVHELQHALRLFKIDKTIEL